MDIPSSTWWGERLLALLREGDWRAQELSWSPTAGKFHLCCGFLSQTPGFICSRLHIHRKTHRKKKLPILQQWVRKKTQVSQLPSTLSWVCCTQSPLSKAAGKCQGNTSCRFWLYEDTIQGTTIITYKALNNPNHTAGAKAVCAELHPRTFCTHASCLTACTLMLLPHPISTDREGFGCFAWTHAVLVFSLGNTFLIINALWFYKWDWNPSLKFCQHLRIRIGQKYGLIPDYSLPNSVCLGNFDTNFISCPWRTKPGARSRGY